MSESDRLAAARDAIDSDPGTPGVQTGSYEDDPHLNMEMLIAEWESGLAEGEKRGVARGFLYGVVASLFVLLALLGFVLA